MSYQLQNLNPLTAEQYDRVKHEVIERIQKRIGGKPERDSFKREYGTVFNVLDIPMTIIFLGALLVSMLHIFDYASITAGHHYETVDFVTGFRFDQSTYVKIQQVAYLLMAEFAMLSFFTVWRVQIEREQPKGFWANVSYLSFWLAIVAAGFVVLVNVVGSGGFNIAGLLPPLFTIGIGIRLEQIMSELISRRTEIDEKYEAALLNWERANEDPTQHSDYLPMLYSGIWKYLVVRKTSNSGFEDAPTEFKVKAVERELERERWAHDLSRRGELGGTAVNPTTALREPQMTTPNGNGAHAATATPN